MAKARSTRPALVFALDAVELPPPVRPAKIPPRFAKVAAYLIREADERRVKLWKAHPEKPIPDAADGAIHAHLEALGELVTSAPWSPFGDAEFVWGFHATVSVVEMAKQFERDGFEVVPIAPLVGDLDARARAAREHGSTAEFVLDDIIGRVLAAELPITVGALTATLVKRRPPKPGADYGLTIRVARDGEQRDYATAWIGGFSTSTWRAAARAGAAQARAFRAWLRKIPKGARLPKKAYSLDF